MSGSIVCVKPERLPPARFANATLQALDRRSVGHQRKQVRPVWERSPPARFTNAVSLI